MLLRASFSKIHQKSGKSGTREYAGNLLDYQEKLLRCGTSALSIQPSIMPRLHTGIDVITWSDRMNSRRIQLFNGIVLIVIALLLTRVFHHRIETMPAPGPFFNPYSGFWQNMEDKGIADLKMTSGQLQDEVLVRYDDRGVPHIFANNDYDLYFAQGFVTARDRLWQVDFQSRAAEGRLSEIAGEQALSYDRVQRRLGMGYGADINAASMMEDPETAAVIEAYAEGFNAWIDQLNTRDYPIEYKIMNAEPERFTERHPALMLMNLSQTLTSGTRAHARTNARALLEENIYRMLYPEELPWVDPMIPPEQNWDFDPLTPQMPDGDFVPGITDNLALNELHPEVGSNSWAVDGSRTQSGYPILASDPHLDVTLPAIWYEVQLHSEGINTYGVSAPAAPGVIIGFNESLAWGITNAGSQVLDVYEIEFRDETRQEYRHDGEWKPVERRVEEIRVRGSETVMDTVLYTHHGPITRLFGDNIASDRFPKGHAVKWLAHKPGNILKAVHGYNRARNQQEFEDAMRHFTNITQNFTYADREGNISIGHFGQFPVRFEGQGAYISDGSDPAYDWNSFIPFEHLPRSFNPDRGFVSTANQNPVTSDYPYHLGRFYANFSRGARINDILRESDKFTADIFKEMLMDDLSLHARKILPFMLRRVELDGYDDMRNDIISFLENWDYHFRADSPVAHFFSLWEQKMLEELWHPLFSEFENNDIHISRPDRTVTYKLLLDDEHDVFQTDVDETILIAFENAAEEFLSDYGDDPESWRYGYDRNFSIGHLADLPGFGRDRVFTGGTPEAINAVGFRHAPSWRMIVELGPEIRAYGHYPGGQPGNPGHPDYDKMIDDWSRGSFRELRFWNSGDEDAELTSSTLILKPYESQ